MVPFFFFHNSNREIEDLVLVQLLYSILILVPLLVEEKKRKKIYTVCVFVWRKLLHTGMFFSRPRYG